ncbi:uncharacterized protein LOC106164030 [Lingula anatina]|uniref:Uncharacterized protein LOC106164030 n=1 Tax=Lingula anatina TaxID=7574 RepID=A0A1S3IG91_LINAN|nr:uncharacterized protein LOC106164030 [Lingula anatina]|eukprot:XP_013397237.1 uncharacterized protein LOC106164030 [Lingula anatina]
MAKFSTAAILLVVCWVSIDTTSAVKCYSCTNCNDPFDKAANSGNTIDCSAGCQKTKAETSGVQSVARTCAVSGQSNGCTETSIAGVTGSVCVCSGELCNGSATVSSSVLLMGLVSIFAAFLLGKK